MFKTQDNSWWLRPIWPSLAILRFSFSNSYWCGDWTVAKSNRKKAESTIPTNLTCNFKMSISELLFRLFRVPFVFLVLFLWCFCFNSVCSFQLSPPPPLSPQSSNCTQQLAAPGGSTLHHFITPTSTKSNDSTATTTSNHHHYHYLQYRHDRRPFSSMMIFRSFSIVDGPFFSNLFSNSTVSSSNAPLKSSVSTPISTPITTPANQTTNNNHNNRNVQSLLSLLPIVMKPQTTTTTSTTTTTAKIDTTFVNQSSHLLINLTNDEMIGSIVVDNDDNEIYNSASAATASPIIDASSVDSSASNSIVERTMNKYRRSLSGPKSQANRQPTALPLIHGAGDDDELLQQRIYITGLEGSRTILPCNVTRPSNDTIDLILWFRGADEKALYSIDARRAPTMQRAKHFSGDELGARAYIDISTRPTGLIIESVKAEDAGEYKCRVDFRKSRSEYRSVQLDVYVPPKEVIIMDEFGQRLSDPVGPFNQGAHLNLICEAEGGKPRPLLYWYKNHELIDQSWTVTAQGIVRNELVLNRLGRNDQGTVLYCQVLLNISETETSSVSASLSPAISTKLQSASNQLINSDIVVNDKSLLLLKNVNSFITLELNLRPLDVRITTVHRPVIAGQSVDIRCESGGAKPPALITWWKGPKRLEGAAMEDIRTDDNRTISTLSFVPQIEDNGQVLACRSDHSVLSDSALEDSWVLSVLFAPKLTISFGASIQHDQIREGSNVSLECHVAANPSVTEIGWLFEGRPLQLYTQTASDHHQRILSGSIHSLQSSLSSDRGYVQIKGNTLLIYNVDRRHSGRYRCVAANAQGEGQSEDILLKVQYTPVCKPNQRFLYGVAKREPIQVLCSVESDPPEVNFRWMFNNSYELVPIKNFHQPTPSQNEPNSLQSIATYVARNKYGYGQLLCWASNRLGEQSEPCVYSVIPAGQPQPLQNCVVRNQSTDGLVVYCDPGDDGGLEQHFFIEVFQAEQGQLWTNLSLTEPPVEFVIDNVPVSTTFVLVLYASNEKGRSNYVTLSASTMPPGSRGSEFLKFTADFGIKPMMYLLVAVVGSLIVSAIVIMIVSKVRTINKSKGRHEPLSKHPSKQHSPSSSSNGSVHNLGLDLLGPDNSAMMQMFDLGPSSAMMPGPSSGTAGLDLEIMTNSSSLYDDSSNIQLNPIYNKTYNPSLLADGTTATPTSPSIHSSGLNVIIKNPMSSIHSQPTHHLDHQSSPSIDSGAPPPFYHSVYNNFATWNSSASQGPSHQGHHPSGDLLLMDSVSYYGTTLSPASSTNQLINVVGTASAATSGPGGGVGVGWDQSGSPHHHHHLVTSSYNSVPSSYHNPHHHPPQFTIGATVDCDSGAILIQSNSNNNSHVSTIPLSLQDETGLLTGSYPLSGSTDNNATALAGATQHCPISLADPTQTSGYFNSSNHNGTSTAILDHSSSNSSSNNNDSGIGTVTSNGSVSNSPNNKSQRPLTTIHQNNNNDDDNNSQAILSTPV